jgi:hypothetical protein
MYILMESQRNTLENAVTRSPAHMQKEVAKYVAFDEAVAACEDRNRAGDSRHYVMNESGREYYAGVWID